MKQTKSQKNDIQRLNTRSNSQHRKGHKKSHPEGYNEPSGIRTKKELIIRIKANNPTRSLKEIALQCGSSHGYARKVWSKYVRDQVTGKEDTSSALSDVVLPFRMHGFVWTQEVPSRFYDDCPVLVSNNSNRQKVFFDRMFSFVIYPGGNVRVYPHVKDGWREFLRDWLNSWLAEVWVDEIVDNLVVAPELHLCAPAPDAPLNFKLHIEGMGKFGFDRTPFKDGTIEYEMDPGFAKRLERLEKAVMSIESAVKHLVLLNQRKIVADRN